MLHALTYMNDNTRVAIVERYLTKIIFMETLIM
jgi:hypothetical protein